jgi:hypothetical protein
MNTTVSKGKRLASGILSALGAMMFATAVSAQTATPKAHQIIPTPSKAGHAVASPPALIPPERQCRKSRGARLIRKQTFGCLIYEADDARREALGPLGAGKALRSRNGNF